MTRRELIERIGFLGAAVALAPIVAACAGGAASPSAAASVGSAVRAAQRIRGRRCDPHAGADAGPVARVRADRLQLARLHRRGRHPLVRGEVPGQGQVRAVRRHRGGLRQARPGRQRLRHLVPDLGRRAAFRRRPGRSSSSTSRCCRTSSTSVPSGPTRATTRATSTRCRMSGGRPASATTRRR